MTFFIENYLTTTILGLDDALFLTSTTCDSLVLPYLTLNVTILGIETEGARCKMER